MTCAWNELLAILPEWLRRSLLSYVGPPIQEIRLRTQQPPELVTNSGHSWLNGIICLKDLEFCVSAATRYSPWTATSPGKGFLTAPGGHRIGLCGEAVCKEGHMSGIRSIQSLCIRVARDYPGISKALHTLQGSILILGAPGWGKTTLLRDLSRNLAEYSTVCVVDERSEVFPPGFTKGKCMDVLYGAPKGDGIENVLRTMSPDIIAVDEITAKEDCDALYDAAWCGVRLLATIHGASFSDYQKRAVYASLREQHIFQVLVILRRDKSFIWEDIA